jgi:6-phosphofructokinase 1
MTKTIKKIAIMTSGGDAPGMNAFIRSATRYAIEKGLEVFGILEGYQGLIENRLIEMNYDSVCNTIHLGGTILKTSRSQEFMTPEGRLKAAKNLNDKNIDALICCGGDGSYAGLKEFANKETGEWQGLVIGSPGTIDNDVSGTDLTIGFDTAVNTAVEAIDKLRDTGDSHSRHFIVEVMGRHCGDIAQAVGLASGATFIAIPEEKTDIKSIVCTLRKRGHDIVVVAEGNDLGGAEKIAQLLEQHHREMKSNSEFRACVLGHIQRGGSPTAKDRILAHRFAIKAVDALLSGETLKATASKADEIVLSVL